MVVFSRSNSVAALLFTILFSSNGESDVLRQRDGAVIYGRIVAQSANEIIFLQRAGASDYIERRLSMSEVESAVRTIDERRLAGLAPNDPSGYMEYAEELAMLRSDREAEALAIRLYLIAARRQQGGELQHCLRALIGLSRTSDEQRRFRELAFRLDRTLPASIVAPPDHRIERPPSPEELDELIDAIRSVRRGDGENALAVFEREASSRLLNRHASICSIQQLRRLAESAPLGLEDIQVLLKLELALTSQQRDRPFRDDDRSWASEWSDQGAAEWSMPELSNVTEFDPELCIYRDGHWLAQ